MTVAAVNCKYSSGLPDSVEFRIVLASRVALHMKFNAIEETFNESDEAALARPSVLPNPVLAEK
jgi:hypothetical protein